MRVDRFDTGRTADQRADRFVVRDLRWQVGDFVLRDVRRVRRRRRGADRATRRAAPRTSRRARDAEHARPRTTERTRGSRRATAIASSLTSVAHTSASGSSLASASASTPEPVPRSATAYDVVLPDHGSRRPRRAPEPRRLRRSRSPRSISVSGRGMSTRRSTMRSMPRNDHAPRTYWSGSPATGARAAASIRVTATAGAASSRSCVGELRRRVARHLRDDPPRLGGRRRDRGTRRARARRVRGSVAPGLERGVVSHARLTQLLGTLVGRRARRRCRRAVRHPRGSDRARGRSRPTR